MQPLISVIIPIYNVEKHIRKCIDSVLNQTYANLEIILVDDGSPDNCGKICDEYAKKDGRIKVIHKENGGLSDARNRGIDVSSGKYIMFVDGDDYVKDTMINVMYERIVNDDSDMAVCRFIHVDECGDVIKTFAGSAPYEDAIVNSENMLRVLANENVLFFIVACCKLYKKELWNDIRFPVGRIHEDEFVAHLIIGMCNLISITTEPLYYYVQHNESITNAKISIKSLDIVDALIDRTKYYLKKGMDFEAANIFYCSVNNYVFRSRKIAKDSAVTNRLKLLRSTIKKMYFKNIFTLLKHLSWKTFMFLSLFILNQKVLDFVLNIFKR